MQIGHRARHPGRLPEQRGLERLDRTPPVGIIGARGDACGHMRVQRIPIAAMDERIGQVDVGGANRRVVARHLAQMRGGAVRRAALRQQHAVVAMRGSMPGRDLQGALKNLGGRLRAPGREVHAGDVGEDVGGSRLLPQRRLECLQGLFEGTRIQRCQCAPAVRVGAARPRRSAQPADQFRQHGRCRIRANARLRNRCGRCGPARAGATGGGWRRRSRRRCRPG